MRVTIVSRIYRPEPAAASFFLGSVADALLAEGNQVEVLTSRPPRGLMMDTQGERVRTFPVLRDRNGYVRGYLPYLSFDVPLAFRLLFTRRPDVVLIEPPPTTGAVVRVVCALRGIPYVYDLADVWSDAADMATGSKTVIRVLRAIERFAMRGAAHLVTISPGVVYRARDLGIDRPITVTGFGADTSEFSVMRAPDDALFVYAGSYSAWHGAEIIVDALADLRTTHPDYTLRVIGNGERDELSRRARDLGVGDAVEFFAPVPPRELLPHLAGAVASIATLKPGTGYDYAFASKAYSSLAAGCPVIFAGPGPTAAFIDEANQHVRAGASVAFDPAALATAMRAFIAEPPTPLQREELGQWIATEHSLAAVARRVAAVLEGVAADRGAQRVNRLVSGPVDWMMRHRSSMPAWIDRLMISVAREPDGAVGRIASRLLGGGRSGPVTTVPDAPVRVYIAPTNYSGQGYRWARALERADSDIGARNMAVALPGGFAFEADTTVPIAVVNSSAEWQEAEWRAARDFTHVLVEAERSIFGRRFGRDVATEIAALEAEGVSVAYLCHGTDIRDPDKHSTLTPWSLYPDDPRTDLLRADARANFRLLSTVRRPTFVSTPDLLIDVPWAAWCPVVVDAQRFATDSAPPFLDDRVRVVHAASAPLQKGSHYIEPAIDQLLRSGILDFRMITGTPAAQMPRVFSAADIVIDQFRVGSYGVAACEAMAAGRVVIGHVLPFVRERVEEEFGMPLPIVEATPDSLRETIEQLANDRPNATAIAASGPPFIARVHSGAASAHVLIDRWIRPRPPVSTPGRTSRSG